MDIIGRILVGVADAAENARVTAAAEEADRPEFPAGFDRTKRVLASMMRENCGASILDSGGAYGRAWQRNLTRKFWEEPETVLSVSIYNGRAEFNVTHNVFHWLAVCCDYSRGMTKRMRRLGKREDICGLELATRFPEYLAEQGHEIGGMYGEGAPFTVNTYNGEDLLSQTIQYVYFRCDGTDYAALQIHGGADVRGGYSEPVIFETSDDHGHGIMDNARAGIAPDWKALKARMEEKTQQGSLFSAEVVDEEDAQQINWSTDDGSHWYFQGSCGRDYDAKQLDKMPAVEIDNESKWERGKVCVLASGDALCPFTGVKLVASFY